MYPLMQPTVEKLSKQLAAGKTMEEIVVSEDTPIYGKNFGGNR